MAVLDPGSPHPLRIPEELPPFDPSSPAFHADPYPIYRRYREQCPVHRSEAGGRGAWYVFRNDDVTAVLRDARFGRERGSAAGEAVCRAPAADAEHSACAPFFAMKRLWVLFRDPPFHTRVRSLINQGFTPAAVERIRPRIAAIASELLDSVEAAGSVELIGDFAARFPAIVIAELLGVGVEERTAFLQHAHTLAAAIDHSQSRAAYVRAAEAAVALRDCLADTVQDHRRHPRDDLISALLAARQQSAAGQESLTEEELLATCALLLLAGSETTINLIGNGMLALLRHPDELARLRAHPALLPAAVEELLRYDSPAQLTDRIAREDVIVGGEMIRAGSQLWLVLGSANRDASVFPDPDRLDITRRPRAHRAFGYGAHFCAGALLARAEGQIAIDTLLRRLPGLRLGAETVEWRESIFIRGLKALPLEWRAARISATSAP